MTRILAILAALALGVFALSTMPLFAWPSSSSAFRCRFGCSPADAQEFDREWDKRGLEAWNATKHGKWVVIEVVATPEG